MSTSKTSSTTVKKVPTEISEDQKLFTKDNYKWMLIGIFVIILGMLLMVGGKSPDPNVFNEEEIYGFRRTIIAPVLIVAGLVIEVYAIMKKRRGIANREIK